MINTRLICLGTVLLMMSLTGILAKTQNVELAFGQVYGSAGFLAAEVPGTMTDAPATVLGFTSKEAHRTVVLTDKAGDYLALLEPGRYCVSAYTRAGKHLQLANNQVRCVDVGIFGKDVRLDVMLVRPKT